MDGYMPGNFCVSRTFQIWSYDQCRFFCGLGRKFAVKYSLLMSIPAVIGAFFVEAGEFTAVSMTVGKGFTYILGMIVAGVTGYLVIRFMLKLSNQVRLRYFAFYSFAAGILILAANYI